jgi:hypothetical protein
VVSLLRERAAERAGRLIKRTHVAEAGLLHVAGEYAVVLLDVVDLGVPTADGRLLAALYRRIRSSNPQRDGFGLDVITSHSSSVAFQPLAPPHAPR